MKAKKNFEKTIRDLAKSELKNAKAKVQKYMESATLSLLGLEKKYGDDYEIDHCSGRNSVLIDAFRELAIEQARTIASGYKPTKEEWSVFDKAFRAELENQFSYAIRDMAKAKAVEVARQAAEKIKVNVDELLEAEFGEKPKSENTPF